MKKKILIAILVGVLCIGSLFIAPVFAVEDSEQSTTEKRSSSMDELRGKRAPLDSGLLVALEKQFGLSLDGNTNLKSLEKNEKLRAAFIEKAKKLGIDTEGKSFEQIFKEYKAKVSGKRNISTDDLRGDRKASLNNGLLDSLEKQYGITLKGKNLKDLEGNGDLQQLFIKKAQSLGIETDGKSFDQIFKEYKAKMSGK